MGGILAAQDACELPRGEQQVSDLKRRQKQPLNVTHSYDELAVVMPFLEDRFHHFVRDVRMLREPAIVVALDRQLDDLVKLCTNPQHFGIMTVDPTFCLGDFDVSVITYQHLFLQCRRTTNHPVFISPVMVHYRKTFSTYLHFASTLVGLRPDLSTLKCFGTDGEEPLFTAFEHEFPRAIHLLCSTHMRRNIKDKLHELRIDEPVKQIVLADVFGKQIATHYIEGLIDSKDEAEFERGIHTLCSKWATMGKCMEGFVRWFQEYKSLYIKKCMLKFTRRDAGLGDSPPLFTTNASESINALLKRKVDYKKSELSSFLDKLRVIEDQERELERAVIDRGKYRFCAQFSHLTRQEDKWFLKMSAEERQTHLKRVASAVLPKQTTPTLHDGESSGALHGAAQAIEPQKHTCRRRLFSSCLSTDIGECSHTHITSNAAALSVSAYSTSELESDESGDDTPKLSVEVNDFSLTPLPVLEGIWKKASELLSEQNAVVKAPGHDDKARMVNSVSGPRPHLVVRKKGGQYGCDKSCPNWQSLSICAHAVAAAEDNGDLITYVSWFKKAKKSLNITKLATTNMPAGRGRKGSLPPAKKKKKVAIKSRLSFSEVINQGRSEGSQHKSQESAKQREEFSSIAKSPMSSPCVGNFELTCHGGSVNVGSVTTSGNILLPRTPPDKIPSQPPPPLIRCASSSPDGLFPS